MNTRCLVGFLGGFLPFTSICATDYCFVDKKNHWHFETDFACMSNANFNKPSSVKHSKMLYAEGTTSLYYNHFVTENNAIVAQLGVNYTHLGWNHNPRFSGQEYPYAIASLSWVSYAVKDWRWVINGGLSFDAKTADIGDSGVYYALLWGRYQYTPTFGMHVGFFGYVGGGRNGYLLPVLGCDWWWSERWEYKAIFPLETSVNYHFTSQWTTALMFTTFGGPYRFPRRVHDGKGRYENGIFEIYSTGIEWDCKFKSSNCLEAGFGAGYNFGGWILVKDSHNHHGRYYKFDGSGYGRAYVGVSF
ncbi:MAG: hypothetical protein NT065_00165 [Chlamydiae bacterium]|nr:hypothetical protein [Chlamydiota bacterium]